MARPKKQDGEGRTELIRARVTLAEKNHCLEQAALAGLSEAEYVRRRSVGYKVPPAPSKADATLLMELNRIGVNLNQLARHANAGKVMSHSIHALLGEVKTLLEKVADDR